MSSCVILFNSQYISDFEYEMRYIIILLPKK